MTLTLKLHHLHTHARRNKWMGYFAVFNRLALAAGFLPAGFVKIMGERFTDLHNNQPMGHYLEALFHTGYYNTFIGVLQVIAAMLLLIPRTVVLGAFLYLPIILNIFILSIAVRFEGSLLTAPLMILANLYLLCWYYDKWKFILPFNHYDAPPKIETTDKKFPWRFFGGALATIILVLFVVTHMYDIMPRNTLASCKSRCNNSKNPGACNHFCDIVHTKGVPLDQALEEYHKAVDNRK